MINMFFTVDERMEINKRSKHVPTLYVREMINIIQDVVNHKNYEKETSNTIITAEDYD
jgi:hypothetical protein